jgi:hypothetical protein
MYQTFCQKVRILIAGEVRALMIKVDDLEEWLHLQEVVGIPEKGSSLQVAVEKQLFLPEESKNDEEDLPGEPEEKEREDTEDEVEEVELVPHPLEPTEK